MCNFSRLFLVYNKTQITHYQLFITYKSNSISTLTKYFFTLTKQLQLDECEGYSLCKTTLQNIYWVYSDVNKYLTPL